MRAEFTIPPSRVTPSLPQTPEAIVKYRCDYCGGHLGLIAEREWVQNTGPEPWRAPAR